MPNISVSLPATDAILSYELSPDFTIGDLKGLISADAGLAIESQWIVFNGKPLSDDAQSLQDAGIKDQDFLICSPKQQARAAASSSAPNPTFSQAEQQGIEQERQRLVALGQDPRVREDWQRVDPQLAAVIDDPARFRAHFLDLRRRKLEELESLNNDWSEENQAKIYEQIRQENVDEQREKIREENPELFGSVTMLYIDCFINDHPVKAFVDSGAQTTVMSPACAEACQIMHLIDKRYQGMARGVGTAKIIGRVHRAPMQIGDAGDLPCSFTVMEGKDVDLLFGLDMLKRYQASIDLKRNCLTLADGAVSVPFLGESEIPKPYLEAQDNEPTVPGPDGTNIGATSGTVKPGPAPPASASASGAQSAAPAAATSSSSPSATHSFSGQGHTLGSAPAPPQPQQTPSAPPRPAAPTPGQAEFPQSSIDLLQSLGASREQAIELLRQCNGNADYAAGLMFEE